MKRSGFAIIFGAGAIAAACGLDVAGVTPSTTSTSTPDATVGPDLDAGSSSGSLPESGISITSCEDTTSDPLNCGVCGHSCLGATCETGMCKPQTLMAALHGPAGLVIDGATAYVAENGGGVIYSAPAATGPTTKVFDTTQAPRTLAFANGRLYWLEQTQIRSVSIDGGTPAAFNSGGGGVPLVISGSDVYYGDAIQSKIDRVDLNLANESEITNEPGIPYGIAVDDTNIYWTVDGAGNGQVRMRSRSGGPAAHTITDSESKPESIVVVGNTVYWTTDSAIRMAQTPDGGASSVVNSQLQPRSLARDGNWLYWLEVFTGSLKAMPLNGTPGSKPLTLVSNESMRTDLQYATAIAFDADYVYYLVTSATDGAVRRVPKLK